MAGRKYHVDVIREKISKTGSLVSLNAVIFAYICKMRFEWSIFISEGILDVTPKLSSFSNVSFNCYSVADQIFNIHPDKNGNFDLYALADILIQDFFLQQEMHIGNLLSEESNRKMDFAVEVLRTNQDASMMLTSDENPKILCEFPLLPNAGYKKPDLEYLYDVTEADPIMINIELVMMKDSLIVTYKVTFPKLMTCSKNIDFPTNYGANTTDENSVIDLVPFIETRILSPWNNRKMFLEELKNLTAVLEYDAIDFSFVLIALRMKHDNMYTICTIEFKLSSSFPSVMPLTCLHDLQNPFSTPIDTSSIKYSKSSTPARLARELLMLSSTVISQQAFGEDILNL